MASEILEDSNGELDYIGRRREPENVKVYTRRARKKDLETCNDTDTATTTTTAGAAATTAAEISCTTFATTIAQAKGYTDAVQESIVRKDVDSSNERLQEDKDADLKRTSPVHSANVLVQTHGDSPQNFGESSRLLGENDVPNSGEVTPLPPQVPCVSIPANSNGVLKPLVVSRVDDRVRFNLCKEAPKNDVRELRKTLVDELDQVRGLVKQLESKELQLASNNNRVSSINISNSSNYVGVENANMGGYSNPHPQHRALVRVNSEAVPVGHQESRPMVLSRVNSDMGVARNLEPRPYSRQLSVSVMENNRVNEFVEKEKRTPKANQYYRNSEFLLGKDRLPSESNKRSKTSNGRKHSGETNYAVGLAFDKSRNQAFRSCNSLLQKLMKHKYGWVFKEPVDAKALGLVDYHDVIKHPMDLGTIKTALSQNLYKSPREFAEDVRLVFRNAMTYNPKGQDVHIMAEELSQIFEERWATIETEYNPYWKNQIYHGAGLPTPNSRKNPPQSHFASTPIPLYGMSTFDRSEPMATPMAVDPKIHRPHVGRTPVPRKPKAKDPNKRDMTYEEKQRLSTHLQGLPPEKLDAIVQIIKRRNTAVSQHDDEIEVDIDSVDTETLWELDRFVTNYKKSLSKYKRKAELALQARTTANHKVAMPNTTPAGQAQIGTDFEKSNAPPAVEGERQGYNGNKSSSSSSSSSDSGSSSSDSDSDSSSADGSDAEHSPKT